MNIKEFAALKVGETVTGMLGGAGRVVETTDSGVRVVWGGAEPNTANQFFYSVQSTAWMHWDTFELVVVDTFHKVNEDEAVERQQQAEGEL